mgnify:CR=1 FL=1
MANFTDEQIAQLSGNQNVQWVSRTGVQFTPEFKILAWEQKQQGRRMKDIFRDNGIDPDILGRKRIENFSVRLDDAVREGKFLPDRRIYNSRPAEAAAPEQMPLEERVRWLIHELEYAKQEVEFLKKLQMANTEARKEWESSTGTGKVCAHPRGSGTGRQYAQRQLDVPNCRGDTQRLLCLA